MATTSQQQAQQPAQNIPAQAAEKGVTTYEVNGEKVKLSYDIVCQYLTKGNASVTRQEVVNYISICKYNRLNPFLNEAYLVKFQGSPAQMIVSKEAMFKRAEECPEYDGIQAGIIVQRQNGEIAEVEGCFKLANDILLGGWAKVYRKDRRFPVVARVNLTEYDKGQSVWKDKKNTMIAKVAKVAALREAFPQKLGAMYAAEEFNTASVAEPSAAAKATADYARRAAEQSRTAAHAEQPAAPEAPTPQVEDAELLEVDETTGAVEAPSISTAEPSAQAKARTQAARAKAAEQAAAAAHKTGAPQSLAEEMFGL